MTKRRKRGKQNSRISKIDRTDILDSYTENAVECGDQLAIIGDLAIWTAEEVCNFFFFISYKWACWRVRGTKTGIRSHIFRSFENICHFGRIGLSIKEK